MKNRKAMMDMIFFLSELKLRQVVWQTQSCGLLFPFSNVHAGKVVGLTVKVTDIENSSWG